jgi:beta-glucanase (GH16 family)
MPKQAGRPGWTLVWNDEFEGDAVDRSKWDFDLGNGFYDYRNTPGCRAGATRSCSTTPHEPENVQVRDSCLFIRAVKAPLHGCGYTSARLKTKARDGTVLFAKLYGRVEFRARVPWGKGLWPALWMLPVDDKYGGWAASGEIDLMEIVGEQPHEVLNSLHFGSAFPRARSSPPPTLPGRQPVSDWHTYAVEWEPGEIRFYVDDSRPAATATGGAAASSKDGQGVEPPERPT